MINADAMRQIAIAGAGIAGLPDFILGDAASSGALIALLAAFPTEEQGIFAGRPPGPAPAKTRAFIDGLVARFGGQSTEKHNAAGSPVANG